MTIRRRLPRGRKDWALGSICLLIAVTSLIIFLQTPGTTPFVRTLTIDDKAEFIQAVNIIVSGRNGEHERAGETMVTKRDIAVLKETTRANSAANSTRELTVSSIKQPGDEKLRHFIVPTFNIGSKTICDNSTDILVYFQSLWSNFMKRRTLRNTWASTTAYRHLGKEIKFVFIIGRPIEVNDQVKINNEQLLHGDIIEGDFIDSYQNLTLKSVIGMVFIEKHCKHVKYVIKVDDDIFVNLFAIIKKMLPPMSPDKDVISCHVIESGKSPIVRNEKSKWYIPPEIFKNRTHLPQFCSGYMVIMTSRLVLDLFNRAKITPLINVDDVYMFGQLTLDIKDIKFIDIKDYLTLWQDKGLESYRTERSYLVAVIVRDSSAMEELWSLTLIDYGRSG